MKKTYSFILATVILVQCVFAPSSLQADDLDYEKDMDYILTKYLLEDYQETLRLLDKHYSHMKNELAYLYGLCYLKLNMNRIAVDYFTITLKEHENNYEVLNNIGAAYFQERNFLEAMKYFHLSFVSNPFYETAIKNYNTAYESWSSQRDDTRVQPVIPFTEKPSIYHSLGWFYYYSGDHPNAVYYFRKAIEEDEQYQAAYISLAYLYDEGNNYDAALDYLLKAERIDSNTPDLYNNLGIVYYHRGDTPAAEAAFKRAIALNHRFAEPHNNLGFLYLDANNVQAAADCFNKSIEANLDNRSLRAESFAGLCFISLKAGDRSRAKDYREAALRLDYRMNETKYLTVKLQWTREMIDLWNSLE